MLVGSVCMSHSPLIDRNRARPEVEKRFYEAVDKAARLVENLRPDVAVVLYPDHVNGFFYKMLPSFCVGIKGQSIGDFGTAAGELDIPEDRALDLTRALLDAGVDTALSYDIELDHGAIQPLEFLVKHHAVPQVIPVFVNCAMPPRPTFERVRKLGEAVGDWARAAPERVLVIGSGGLSHDPPIPGMATATPEVRAQLIQGRPLSHSQRMMRQNRVLEEGLAMTAGQSDLLALDPDWDRKVLDALLGGDLNVLDDSPDDEISATGGRGGHEIRSWFAAMAAMGAGYSAEEVFYEPIPEWITGMGIMTARPA